MVLDPSPPPLFHMPFQEYDTSVFHAQNTLVSNETSRVRYECILSVLPFQEYDTSVFRIQTSVFRIHTRTLNTHSVYGTRHSCRTLLTLLVSHDVSRERYECILNTHSYSKYTLRLWWNKTTMSYFWNVKWNIKCTVSILGRTPEYTTSVFWSIFLNMGWLRSVGSIKLDKLLVYPIRWQIGSKEKVCFLPWG